MLFCQNCRSEVPAHARVCPHCGFGLATPTQSSNPVQVREQQPKKPTPMTPPAFHLPDHQSRPMLQDGEKSVSQPERTFSKRSDSPVLQGPVTPFPAIPSKPQAPKRPRNNSFAPLTPLPSTRLPESSVVAPDQSASMQKPPRQLDFKPAEAAPSQENEQPPASRQEAEPAKKLTLTQRYAADQPTTSVPSAPTPSNDSRTTPDATDVVSSTGQRSQQQPQAIVEPQSRIEIVRQPTTPPQEPMAQAAGKSAASSGTPAALTQGQAMEIQNILRQAAIASTSSVINTRRKPYHKQHADFWIVVLVIACIICLLGLYIVFTYKVPRMSQPHPTTLATITQTVSRI